VCFPHGGGRCRVGWAAWTTAIVGAWPLGATIRLPSEYLAGIWCDSLISDPAGLRYLVERVGAGQVLLGSDQAARLLNVTG
jgi:aminocarboxymuconate-semialdehyde decarboxylase